MICCLTRLALPLYVGEDLGRRTTCWVRRHLARCPACAEHEQRWKQARVTLHELHAASPINAPANLAEQIAAALPAKKTRRAEAGHATLIRRWAVAATLVAVPAGVITLALLRGAAVQPSQAPVVHDLTTTPGVAPSAPLAGQAPSANAPAFGRPGSAEDRAAKDGVEAASGLRSRPERAKPGTGVAVRSRTAPGQARGAARAGRSTGAVPETQGEAVAPNRSSLAATSPQADRPKAPTDTSPEVTRLLRRLLDKATGDQGRRSRCPVVESLTYPVGTQVLVDLPESNTTIVWIIPKKES